MSERPVATRLQAVCSRLGCSPTEMVALLLLVTGALTVLGVMSLRTPGVAEPEGGATHEEHNELEETDDPASASSFVAAGEVTVHVAGAVSTPGLYELAGGSRVADALDAAGGPTGEAVLDDLNLARAVNDGERLLVADRAMAEAADAAGAQRLDGTLDINRATVDELEGLPGVGPVIAERIVEFRDTHGPFAQAGDMRDVPGVGEKMFDALAALIGT